MIRIQEITLKPRRTKITISDYWMLHEWYLFLEWGRTDVVYDSIVCVFNQWH